jgi:hypothetical protein
MGWYSPKTLRRNLLPLGVPSDKGGAEPRNFNGSAAGSAGVPGVWLPVEPSFQLASNRKAGWNQLS